jgi:hypothetical protein
MSPLDVATVAMLGMFVVLLIRAAYLLRHNPYQRVREQERLSGPFPRDMPLTERLRLLGWKGISPDNPAGIWPLLFVVGIGFVVLLWIRAASGP